MSNSTEHRQRNHLCLAAREVATSLGQKCQRLDELSNESNQLLWCPWRVWSLLICLLVTCAQCSAQLTILNPNHLNVPEEKANALLSTACRVVAQEFHVSDISALRFSLVLVLGEKGWENAVKKFWQRLAVTWVFVVLLPGPNTGRQQDSLVAESSRRAQETY